MNAFAPHNLHPNRQNATSRNKTTHIHTRSARVQMPVEIVTQPA
jgi:hypothetical protein